MKQATTARVSDYCVTHRNKFSARAPDLSRLRNQDEVCWIGADDGLFEFICPPGDGISFGEPPLSMKDVPESDHGKYLWVITSAALPGALEHPVTAVNLSRGSLTHTNLTGGTEALTAGELWFQNEKTIMINGASSRYTPRTSGELESAAEAFKSAGYAVANMGWDEEIHRPLRVQTDKLIWL